jgi:Rieske Fe-S protein
VALYRDEEGKLYRRSALCPHVGCIVEWNPNDKSFDCPCHGSQFDRCVAGPSTVDLEELASEPAPSGPEKPEPSSN